MFYYISKTMQSSTMKKRSSQAMPLNLPDLLLIHVVGKPFKEAAVSTSRRCGQHNFPSVQFYHLEISRVNFLLPTLEIETYGTETLYMTVRQFSSLAMIRFNSTDIR